VAFLRLRGRKGAAMPSTATDRLYGLTASVAIKPPCRVATTANITLSGLQTVDGVALAASDRVLVKDQTSSVDNGIYEANTSAWTRSPDFDGTRDAVNGTLATVSEGSTNNETIWKLTTANPVVIGASALTFEKALLLDSATAAFIQTGAGAVERDMQSKAREIVSFEDFGAAADGVTDDSDEIEAALNSGRKNITGAGKNYKITRLINLHTSGVTVDLTGCLITQATTNTSAFRVGYNGSAFAKTDDITFIRGELIGADNGLTTTTSAGIVIQEPTTNPYVRGGGCSRIKTIGTRFTGWCASISGTAADDILVDDIRSTGERYHAAASAGGYGCLFQTCWDVKITDKCRFIGGADSRHAIYISGDPGRAFGANNVCDTVTIGKCTIDWSAVSGTTGFEAGIVIRGASNVNADYPTIIGAYGGMLYELENAPGSNISIGVIASGVRSTGAGEVSGVQFTRSSGTNRASNVTIRPSTISLDGANTHGVQLQYIDGLTSGGHTITGSTYISGIYTVDCTDVAYSPSTIRGTKTSGALDFAQVSVANSNISIDRHVISGSGVRYRYYTVPTDLRFTFPRSVQIASNGAGTITVSNDEEVVGVSAASEANGLTLTVDPSISLPAANWSFTSASSSIAAIYHRTTGANTVTIGVLGISAGALAALPAATNGYTIQATVLH
jgi:hypothetical protein